MNYNDKNVIQEKRGWICNTDMVRCYNCYVKVRTGEFVTHCADKHPHKEMVLLRDIGWGKYHTEHFGVRPNDLRCDLDKAFINTTSWKLMAPCDNNTSLPPVEPVYL